MKNNIREKTLQKQKTGNIRRGGSYFYHNMIKIVTFIKEHPPSFPKNSAYALYKNYYFNITNTFL